MEEITIKVLFFAQAKELVGSSEKILQLPSEFSETTTENLKSYIIKKFPELTNIANSFVLAVNCSYCQDEIIKIQKHTEVAIIPPISGG